METLREHNEISSGPTGLDGLVSLSLLKKLEVDWSKVRRKGHGAWEDLDYHTL